MSQKSKPPRRPKLPVSLTDIEENLAEQLAFLEKSARDFDAGDASEFKRMAAALRILLYDGPTSHSVAKQLGLKSGKFVAAGGKFDPTNLMPEWPLAIMHLSGSGAVFLPALDRKNPPRHLDFEDWWDETVLKDIHDVEMSRGDLILVVANQAGGSHVDPETDERYHRLAKEHSIGMTVGYGSPRQARGIPLEHIEKVYLRHIVFEVIETLRPQLKALLGNRGCSCGSGRKARYCCLKGS